MLAVREAIGEPEPSDAQRDLGGGGGAAPAFLPAPRVLHRARSPGGKAEGWQWWVLLGRGFGWAGGGVP